ncbi:hypothetical protein ABZ860_29855 [Microbispora sp. NPDC046973]|uniref:hypothetical protein n=1 Tax=Microbispora sp. NPDC046973 TaxID=3155022 RepID=UPI0033E06009
MPLGVFTLLTTAGSLLWNTVFVLTGWTLGENWSLVRKYVDVGTNAVVAAVVLAVLVFVGVRLSERRRGRHVGGCGPSGLPAVIVGAAARLPAAGWSACEWRTTA